MGFFNGHGNYLQLGHLSTQHSDPTYSSPSAPLSFSFHYCQGNPQTTPLGLWIQCFDNVTQIQAKLALTSQLASSLNEVAESNVLKPPLLAMYPTLSK